MKIKYLIYCLLLISTKCVAQFNSQNDFKLSAETEKYCIQNETFYNLTFKFTNTGKDTIWFWLEKENPWKVTDSIMIKNYFYQIRDKSDMSLYQIGIDVNVTSFIPKVFDNFIKYILPGDCFYIQLLSKNEISDSTKQKVSQNIKKQIVTYDNSEILKYIPDINNMSKCIFYNGDIITFELKYFEKIPK